MFKIAAVVFRECLEIALLIGIITAVTKPIKRASYYILAGILLGSFLAAIPAFFTGYLTELFEGTGDEIFDSCVILCTAAMISRTVVWMQGYAAKLRKDFGTLSERIAGGEASKLILVSLVATTVLREGAELILFIYGISSTKQITVDDYVAGFGIGCFSGLSVGMLLYFGLIRFAGKYIFTISTTLLILIAASLSSQAAGILTSAGIIEIFTETLWDSSGLISDQSFPGKILNTILGYDSKPNGLQLIFYLSTIGLNIFMIRLKKKSQKQQNA